MERVMHAAPDAQEVSRRIVADARKPRDRDTIEASITKAALHGTTLGMMALQMEVLLDIRDFMAEAVVRLCEIETAVRP